MNKLLPDFCFHYRQCEKEERTQKIFGLENVRIHSSFSYNFACIPYRQSFDLFIVASPESILVLAQDRTLTQHSYRNILLKLSYKPAF
jgi:hypothetical protein